MPDKWDGILETQEVVKVSSHVWIGCSNDEFVAES